MQVLFKLDFYLHVGSHFVKRPKNVVCAASVANETLSWLSSFRTRTILGKHWENWNNNNLCIFPQAFLIAFTSQFLPKMLYRGTISPDGSLQGYTNYSLAWAPVNSTSVPCRYVWVYIQYGVKYLFKTHKIYLQVEWWALGQWKGRKNALNNNICCGLFKIIFLFVFGLLGKFPVRNNKMLRIYKNWFHFGVSTKHCPEMTRTVCARRTSPVSAHRSSISQKLYKKGVGRQKKQIKMKY